MECGSRSRAYVARAAREFRQTGFVARPAQTDVREPFRVQPRVLRLQFHPLCRRDESSRRDDNLRLSMESARLAHKRFWKLQGRVGTIAVVGDNATAVAGRWFVK